MAITLPVTAEARTLAQLGDSTNTINQLAANGGVRLNPTDVLVCRMTDHADDGGTTDPNNHAIFTSDEHGAPWKKYDGQKKVIQKANALVDNLTTGVTILYPNFDYNSATWAPVT